MKNEYLIKAIKQRYAEKFKKIIDGKKRMTFKHYHWLRIKYKKELAECYFTKKVFQECKVNWYEQYYSKRYKGLSVYKPISSKRDIEQDKKDCNRLLAMLNKGA